MGISKIPRLHKNVPPLRFQKCPFSAKGKIVVANSHRGHESMPMKYTPIQTVTKTKMGTSAMHRSDKPYVHAIMKNEALLDAEMEWGRMTPSPNNFVGKKRGVKTRGKLRQKAAMNLPLFAAMTGEILPPLAALCHRELPEFAAVRGAVSSNFNFHLLATTVFRR